MKKIINRKIYDTDNAIYVYGWSNGCSSSDFNYRVKELYRTNKGNWFIYHSGGAMTDMSVSCGTNQWRGSEDIEPITERQALRFLEEHGEVEEALRLFGNEIEEA